MRVEVRVYETNKDRTETGMRVYTICIYVCAVGEKERWPLKRAHAEFTDLIPREIRNASCQANARENGQFLSTIHVSHSPRWAKRRKSLDPESFASAASPREYTIKNECKGDNEASDKWNLWIGTIYPEDTWILNYRGQKVKKTRSRSCYSID